MTVRSGVDSPFWYGCDFRDLNPGGIVVANGDIIIWTFTRNCHAGAGGNSQCMIMASQMEPTQLRIANYVAGTSKTQPTQFYPEIAHVKLEGIRITKAADFLSPSLSNS